MAGQFAFLGVSTVFASVERQTMKACHRQRKTQCEGKTVMITGEKNAEAKVEETRIVGDIRKLFASYGPTFVQLADGERSDMSALLNFYGAPLRFIGPNFYKMMKDEDDITAEEGRAG